jgi:type 1 glutamine amidotransferase
MTTPARCRTGVVDVLLVVGGKWHDLDFARRELLVLLGDHDAVRCTVRDDFTDTDAIDQADVVIAYTCDVRPTPQQSAALTAKVHGGGRLLALHATNSAIDAPAPGEQRMFSVPDAMPEFTALIGSRFLAHPRIAPARIDVCQPQDRLVLGIESFETTDPASVCAWAPDLAVILATALTAQCPGFPDAGVEVGARLPVLYRRQAGAGVIVYFTLGHCRGRFDVRDMGIDDLGHTDRIAWDSPQYRAVLKRCVDWAVHGDNEGEEAA